LKPVCQVRITAHFRQNLADIEDFLSATQAAHAFDELLDELADKVIPNLENFPGMGRDFMTRSPGSVEVVQGLSALQKLGASLELREYIFPPYAMLYAASGQIAYLLAIRHHRQLSFDFAGLWGDV